MNKPLWYANEEFAVAKWKIQGTSFFETTSKEGGLVTGGWKYEAS